MGVFKKWTRRAVETVKDVASEIATDSVEEKVNIWSGVASIAGFITLIVTSIRGAKREERHVDIPDYRSITINNYYYEGRHNNGRSSGRNPRHGR